MTTETEIDARAGGAKSVHIRTYGCQMNVYDSERMADLLRPLGYVTTDDAENADLVVLNTCHIREKASEKLFSDLGRLRIAKRSRADRPMTIAVAGCVAQAEGAEIIARAPDVDLVFGPQAFHRLPEMLAKAARARGEIIETDFAVEEKFDRLAARTAEGPTAFLTVQEGCDKFCTFCVVPYTRGPEVARKAEAILAEASALVAQGVREITLLGQNVNAWRAAPLGRFAAEIAPNNDGSWGLGQLCRALALALPELARLRFTTSHPRDMDDGLVAALAEVPALMPYLHLPVQSGSDRILDAMNRGHTRARYAQIIAAVRSARPDIALSSDFIVGFPGETDDDFAETLDLVETTRFASAFAFKFSRRPGTPAAVMRGQVAEETKDARLARLLSLLEQGRNDFNVAQIGRVLPVLWEKPGRYEGQLVGRSPYLQSVHAAAPHSVLGLIEEVRIVGVTPNALTGERATTPAGARRA